jgi:hypothetical protein
VPAFSPCALIPTYDNPRTVRAVVERVRAYTAGRGRGRRRERGEGRREAERLGADGLAAVTHRARNGGKGAAVKTGFAVRARARVHARAAGRRGRAARARGHPAVPGGGAARPEALVLGAPIYDASAPRGG